MASKAARFDGVTLSLDHSFSWGSLTSTTAWRGFDTENRGDYDGTNNINTYLDTANVEHNNSWYQEFKLSGNTDLIDWVSRRQLVQRAGAPDQRNQYLSPTASIACSPMCRAPATPTRSRSTIRVQSLGAPWNQYPLLGLPWGERMNNVGHFKAYAAYGDVIWHLTDRLNLTTGARFTRDEKTFTWFNPPRSAPELDASLAGLAPLLTAFGIDTSIFQQNIIFNDGSAAPVGVLVENKNTWNNFSPRVVLDYKLTPDMMLYGSVTKGYKAGGYNSVQIGSNFAPEDVTNYEGGIKMLFPQHDLLMNVTTYYYRYDNRQSLSLDPNSAGSGVPRYLVTSTDQQANGAEFELQWQPVEAFQLGFNAAYIDATYRTCDSGLGRVARWSADRRAEMVDGGHARLHLAQRGRRRPASQSQRGLSRKDALQPRLAIAGHLPDQPELQHRRSASAYRCPPGLDLAGRSLGRGGVRQQPVRQALRDRRQQHQHQRLWHTLRQHHPAAHVGHGIHGEILRRS